VRDNALAGVHIVDGEVDLHDGEVARNPIGANVQAPGFDLARLQDRVRYVDNGEALSTSVLPVPDAAVPES
jgi:hypothetical protein